ncbi:MAG: hypothetical protein EU532_13520 [Promethearchaeota archaeon]|nr:MAG: hypothetical protein EU532_13520 [Candidatus Lokiarchaeota archaeon]
MSEELKTSILKVKKYFTGFTNYIELKDFRSFLLFTLTSQIPTNILAQMGLGGTRDVINLPYNPLFKIYYQKINMLSAGSLIVYVKSAPIKDELMVEKDDSIFKQYLNSNELSLAFRGKEKVLFPKISDCSTFEMDSDTTELHIEVDDLFHSLESFMAILEPNILFVIDKEVNEPDLLFTFNMMPQLPGKLKKKILKIDVFLDKDHKTKDIPYIKREEDYKLIYMQDIKEISHTDLYKSAFSLVIHIKSFTKPY